MIKILALSVICVLPRQSSEELLHKAAVVCSNPKLRFNEKICNDLYTCFVNKFSCDHIARKIIDDYERGI